MLYQAHSLVSRVFYRVDLTYCYVDSVSLSSPISARLTMRSFSARFAFSFRRRNRSCCQVSQSRKLYREYAVWTRERSDIGSSVTWNDVCTAKIPAHAGENMAVYFPTDFPPRETLLRNILQDLRLVMQHSAYFRSHQFLFSLFVYFPPIFSRHSSRETST